MATRSGRTFLRRLMRRASVGLRCEKFCNHERRPALCLLTAGADHHAPQANLEMAIESLRTVSSPDAVQRSSLDHFGHELVRRTEGVDLPAVKGNCAIRTATRGPCRVHSGRAPTRSVVMHRSSDCCCGTSSHGRPWPAVAIPLTVVHSCARHGARCCSASHTTHFVAAALTTWLRPCQDDWTSHSPPGRSCVMRRSCHSSGTTATRRGADPRNGHPSSLSATRHHAHEVESRKSMSTSCWMMHRWDRHRLGSSRALDVRDRFHSGVHRSPCRNS
jgi:hypothetical protein